MDYMVKILCDLQIQTLSVLENINDTLEELSNRALEMEWHLQSIREELEHRNVDDGIAPKPRSEARVAVRPEPPELEYQILARKDLDQRSYCRVKITNQVSPDKKSLKRISQQIFPGKVSWVFVIAKDNANLLGYVENASGIRPIWIEATSQLGSNKVGDPWAENGRFANRVWHDASHSYSVEAVFESCLGSRVKLIQTNNEPLEVDYQKLSDTDRKWIDSSADLLP